MKTLQCVLGAGAVCGMGLGVWAQPAEPPADSSPLVEEQAVDVMDDDDTPPGVRFVFDAGTTHQFSTGLDDAGDFAVSRFFTVAGVRAPIDERFTVTGRVLYSLSHYDFDGVARFGGSDPWENVHTLALNANLSYQIDDAWSVFGGPILTFSGEGDADIEDTFTGGGVVGATWTPTNNLRLGMGVTVTSQLEDDVSVFPLIVLNWRFADQWTLRSATLDAGSIGGGGLELAYELTDHWTLAGGAVYQSGRFRLDDEGFAPDGIGENSRVPLYLRATWNPSRQVGVSILGGITVGGELTIEDDNGDRLFQEDYDPAPFAGVNVVLRF